MLESTDLTSPTELFPAARRMDRKIILHVGPTNSGKTYSALSRFENCASGLYCGPLRLLAHEIYDKMNRKGVPCNLLTGEERRESDDVDLYSATVEMAPLNRIYDVAIIDEIQMINDEHRGWAWTQALLGLQAREIHLCGESTVVDLIKRICASIGEDVEVNQYNRLTSLHLSPSLDGQFGNVKKGDAVVTFSRRNIFAVKKHIEESTGFKCAVIYGSLPPETRAEQARLFNEPGSGFDVLVASDAIGMGLNLNIKRIVFERLTKFDGEVSRYLSVSQVKQIAGRAGRFGTEHPEGYVCALDDIDHERLKYYMNADLPLVETAGLLPTLEQVEEFSNKFPSMGFTSLLERYEDLSRLDGDYFLCNLRNQKEVATLLENKPLELRDRFIFTNAPHSVDGGFADKCMMLFVDAFIERRECPIDQKIVLPRQPPATIEALRVIEGMHKIITLYLWLR
ncbi:P-loop containing nucleoside triphosphate hydrolase protein [Polychytrium aggregatum]|uniref:P-loop containing nucleoside triphosphate hydrolase protein n=1 Tax=Polychytrium aggregatum TaxID=110093 RepID=UPI0022FDFB3B|nr:P-loop containing nucleoside triphosphate hydrolase protein [Polychytrium aggregatum]KAI9202798.1 P-loop containing nucleoside triphosphate hydrolase protein [Polychytrium aggregatum]